MLSAAAGLRLPLGWPPASAALDSWSGGGAAGAVAVAVAVTMAVVGSGGLTPTASWHVMLSARAQLVALSPPLPLTIQGQTMPFSKLDAPFHPMRY